MSKSCCRDQIAMVVSTEENLTLKTGFARALLCWEGGDVEKLAQ